MFLPHCERLGLTPIHNRINYTSVYLNILKMDLQEVGCGASTGSSWLRITTGGGNL
jgi:hypothetical protein